MFSSSVSASVKKGHCLFLWAPLHPQYRWVQCSTVQCSVCYSAVRSPVVASVFWLLRYRAQCSAVQSVALGLRDVCSVECCRAERRGGMAGHSIWLLAVLCCIVLHLHFYSYATNGILIVICSQPTVRYWWDKLTQPWGKKVYSKVLS